MFGLKTMRRGCFGCGGLALGAVVLVLLLWFFAPGVIDAVVDWVLYVEPPAVAVTPNGGAEVKKAVEEIYLSVEGDAPPKPKQIVLTEGSLNGLLGGPSDGSALRAARVDLGDDSATLYAAIDLEQLSKNDEYKDLLSNVPSMLRDRRVSVRVTFSGLTTANNRLTFTDVTTKVGRVWVPFSGAWALPILQRVAEKKLGTRLPEDGLPLPAGSSAKISGDRLTLDLGPK